MAIATPTGGPPRRAPPHQQSWFESLYRHHQRDIYWFTLRILRRPEDAEDATQTAFLSAYRALVRGDRPEKPLAWLFTIARNICYRRFRTQARRPLEVAFDPERAEARADDGPTASEIRDALDRLSCPQRTAVVLRELEGLSYAEIASTLGLSIPAVATAISRGRRALREELEGAGLTPHTVVPKRRRRVAVLLPFERALSWLASWFGRTELSAKVAVGLAVVGGGVGGTWLGTATEPHSPGERPQQASRALSALGGPLSLGVHRGDALDRRGGLARTAGRGASADPGAEAIHGPPNAPQTLTVSESASRRTAQTQTEPASVAAPSLAQPTVPDATELLGVPAGPSLPPTPELAVPSLPVPPSLPAPELPAPTLPVPPLPPEEQPPPAAPPLPPTPPAPPLP